MQAGSHLNERGSIRQRFSKITFYTFLCFALAGLLAGFAYGGFIKHNQSSSMASSRSSDGDMPSIAEHTSNAQLSPTPEDIQLANPIIGVGDYTSTEIADGATSYMLSAQIINKITNQPIQVNDVTCRLWLTRDAQGTQTALSANNYALPKAVNALGQPFPAEEQGALNFTGSARQVRPCASSGKTSWTYTLAATLDHGPYFLVVLADWKGIHYNWYMVQITIPGSNNGNAGSDGNSGSNNSGPNAPGEPSMP